MNYKYAVDDSDDKKLCRIAYGLAKGSYSIDRFIYDYVDYFNGKMENSAFRRMYYLLGEKVGSDAFSVLQRQGKSESDFNALCDRIRKYMRIMLQQSLLDIMKEEELIDNKVTHFMSK